MKRIGSSVILVLLLFSALTIVYNIKSVKGWAGTISPYNLHERMTRDALEGLVETGLWRAEDIGEIPKYSNEVDQVLPHCKLSCHRVTQYQRLFESYGGDVCNLAGAEWEASYYIGMARKSYVAGDMDEFQKCLGYAIHYIQDAACPPHVFPFQEGIGNAHYDFEVYTAREYDSKNWKQLIRNAPIQTVESISDLLIKVNDTANWVNETFQPPRVGYIRQDGVPIGDLPEGWDWFMTDEDVGEIMEKVASLVKGVALYAHAEKKDIIVPDNYPTIQDAINEANSGDIIYVRKGTYSEKLLVDKTVSLIGEDFYQTIIDGGGVDKVVTVTANNVLITNFTIKNSGYGQQAYFSNIYLDSCKQTLIKNNNIRDNGYGIYLYNSSNNIISSNKIENNFFVGIYLHNSSYNNVSSNIISNTYYFGVILWYGLHLCNSFNNIISSNTIAASNYAIYVDFSSGNLFIHNIFTNNEHPIQNYGGSTNTWDDGYPFGGNYWSSYVGVDLYGGPYQNMTGSDGIGDAPYILDAYNIDRFPFITSWFMITNEFTFNVSWEGFNYPVKIFTKSDVLSFVFDQSSATVSFPVKGISGMPSYCYITIPKALLKGEPWTVKLNGTNWTFASTSNETHSFIYFNYTHSSTYEVIIQGTWVIPEFPSTTILTLFIPATLFAAIFLRKKRKVKP